jgi:predicted amidohydrolase YtcJ
MKKNLFTISLLFVVGTLSLEAGFSQNPPALVHEMGYADTLLVNGKIVTMDDRSAVPNSPGHTFEAMAIKGKKIMALGTTAEMKRLAGPKTQLVDVGERTVIPGLIATHYHTDLFANWNYGPQLGLVDPSVKLSVVAEKTAEATVKQLRETILNAIQVRKIPKGQWISVDLKERGDLRETREWFYYGRINRRQLDKGTENHPVYVGNGQRGILNSRAIAEFTKVFPDWAESTNLENHSGASEIGYAATPETKVFPYAFWWKDKPLETFAEAQRLQGLSLQKLGITTVSTRILEPRIIAAFHLLNREGKLPHRLAYYIEPHRGNLLGLKSTREFYKAIGAIWTTHAAGDEMLWLAGMSNEIWDSGANEVCLGPDVPASPEIKALERCPGPGSKPWESIKTALLNGWRPVGVHGYASHGVRLYIQMLEEVMEEGNYSLEYMRNLRTTLEHAVFVGNFPDLIAGIKKFGIILNPTPSYLSQVPATNKRYGGQLSPLVMPVKSWISQGVRVTFEADFTDFWTPIYILVTRKIPKRVRGDIAHAAVTMPSKETFDLASEEVIDRVTALKMTTTWGSEYMLAEDTLGTLEPGKYADFAVLDKDFFTIPIEEIRDLKVVMTGLNGKIVYDGNKLASNHD